MFLLRRQTRNVPPLALTALTASYGNLQRCVLPWLVFFLFLFFLFLLLLSFPLSRTSSPTSKKKTCVEQTLIAFHFSLVRSFLQLSLSGRVSSIHPDRSNCPISAADIYFPDTFYSVTTHKNPVLSRINKA